MMEFEKVKFDDEFLELHRQILILSEKLINRQNFIASFIDISYIHNFLCLDSEVISGYILNATFRENNKMRNELFHYNANTRRWELKETFDNYVFESYLKKVFTNEINDELVFFVKYNEIKFDRIISFLSPPFIISGLGLHEVTRRVNNQNDLLAIVLDKDTLYIQSNIDIKRLIYKKLSKKGNIGNISYQTEVLQQRALLWGVPPSPNIEQANQIIQYLSK